MSAVQKLLFALGLLFIALAWLWPWLKRLPLGRLPGDVVIRGEGFAVYLPFTTMLLLSLVLSLLLSALGRWLGRG